MMADSCMSTIIVVHYVVLQRDCPSCETCFPSRAGPAGRPAKAVQPPMSLVPAGLSISPLVQAGPASPILPGLSASVGGSLWVSGLRPSFKRSFPPECCFPTALLTPPGAGRLWAALKSSLFLEKIMRFHLGAREATGAAGIGLGWGETPAPHSFGTFGTFGTFGMGDRDFPQKNAGPQNLKQTSGAESRCHGITPGWTVY